MAQPFYALAETPYELADLSQAFLMSKQAALDRAKKVEIENLQLKAKLQKFQSLQNENVALKKLLDIAPTFTEKMQVARLLDIEMGAFSHKMRIDRGTQQGVYKGQPVLDAKGVMGMVIEPYEQSSRVLLLTDVKHAIPVLNLRNGLRSIVKGTGDPSKLQLLHVTDIQDFKVGDKLVTSGLGGQFPAGYPVGYIISLKFEPGKPFGDIKVRPLADLNASRQVLLIWPTEHVK